MGEFIVRFEDRKVRYVLSFAHPLGENERGNTSEKSMVRGGKYFEQIPIGQVLESVAQRWFTGFGENDVIRG